LENRAEELTQLESDTGMIQAELVALMDDQTGHQRRSSDLQSRLVQRERELVRRESVVALKTRELSISTKRVREAEDTLKDALTAIKGSPM
ncbi:hypothetical protein KIPB_015343, partial [Kipferlia bialata]